MSSAVLASAALPAEPQPSSAKAAPPPKAPAATGTPGAAPADAPAAANPTAAAGAVAKAGPDGGRSAHADAQGAAPDPADAADPSPSPGDGADAAGFRLAVTTPPQPASAAGPAAQPPAVAQAVPLTQFAGAVAARARGGATDFAIRLDPPDLGEVSVRLTIAPDGQVGAHFTVERPETLNLLRQDARGLQDALQQAGFRSDIATTSFQLKGDGGQSSAYQQPSQPPPAWQQAGQQSAWQQSGQQPGWQQPPQHRAAAPPPPAVPQSQATPPPVYRPRPRPAGGLDITV